MAERFRFRLRTDTAARWTTLNPILALGEPGLETDTNQFKVGDGGTHWDDLDYYATTISAAELAGVLAAPAQTAAARDEAVAAASDAALSAALAQNAATAAAGHESAAESAAEASQAWANGFDIGTVTTGAPGGVALATITGTAPNRLLNLTIPQGPQGEQGVQGIQGPAGPRGMTWRGTWDNATDYAEDDAVYHNGWSWFASEDPPVGEEPSTGSAYWWELAAQGIQGIQGIQGPVGPQGLVSAATDPTVLKPPGTLWVNTATWDVWQAILVDGTDWDWTPAGNIKGATGARGVTPRGVWSAATAYAVDDLATHLGSTYRRKIAGTTATAPGSDVTNWEVFAQKGADGTGAVNTVNSVAPTSGNVDVKHLALSGVTIAAGSQWTRIAAINIPSTNTDAQVDLRIYGGSSTSRFQVDASLRVRQAALGAVPGITLVAGETYTFSTTDVVAVTTQNDATATNVELWLRNPAAGSVRLQVLEQGRQFNNGAAVFLIYDAQTSQAALPAGTQTAAVFNPALEARYVGLAGDQVVAGNKRFTGTTLIGSGTAAAVIADGATATLTTALTATTTSGKTGVGVMVHDGTRNRRAGLFVNDTDGVWGLSSSASSGGPGSFVIADAYSGSERLRIDVSGNMGVGTTSPLARLHTVSGTAGTPTQITQGARSFATITNKALTANVATLTTSAAHGYSVGRQVIVTGVDATFNGTFTITAVTATTFSYALTAADVASVASGGSATSDIQTAALQEWRSGTGSVVALIGRAGTGIFSGGIQVTGRTGNDNSIGFTSGGLYIEGAAGNAIYLRPNGAGNNTGIVQVTPVGMTVGGNTTPTHTLTHASTGTGAAFYNTTDQTTNYERARLYWTGGEFTLGIEKGGTGANRPIGVYGSLGQSLYLGTAHGSAIQARTNSASANSSGFDVAATLAGAGQQYGLTVSPTINQSGAGGYAAIRVNVTETATGSGTKRLAEFAVGGTMRAYLDNNGALNHVPVGVGNAILTSALAADTVTRLAISGSGTISWGTGAAAMDTNLYRSAADTLKTDDSLIVGVNLNAIGQVQENGVRVYSPGNKPSPADIGAAESADLSQMVTEAYDTSTPNNFVMFEDAYGKAVVDSGVSANSFEPVARAINAQTGTTYTLVLADRQKVVTISNAAVVTLTVPPNSSVAFPIGTYIEIVNMNTGDLTIAAGAGVTLRSAAGLKVVDQYGVAGLRKIGTDEWVVMGRTSA